jgi:hypothetical protein
MSDENIKKKEEMIKSAEEDYKSWINNQKLFCKDNYNLFAEPESSDHFSCIVFYHNNDLSAYNNVTNSHLNVKISPNKLREYHIKYLNEFQRNNIEPDINYRKNLFLVSIIFTPEFYLESYPQICLHNYNYSFEGIDSITRLFLCSQTFFMASTFRAHQIYMDNQHDNIIDTMQSLHFYMFKLLNKNKIDENSFNHKIENLTFFIDEFSADRVAKISNLLAAKLVLSGNECNTYENIEMEIKKTNQFLKENLNYGDVINNVNDLFDYFIKNVCIYYAK